MSFVCNFRFFIWLGTALWGPLLSFPLYMLDIRNSRNYLEWEECREARFLKFY